MVNKQIFKFSVKNEMLLAIYIFLALTIFRFLGEVVEPIWFPLLFAYAFIPLLIVKKENWKEIGLKKPEKSSNIIIGSILAVLVKIITIYLLFYYFGTSSLNWMHGIKEHYNGIPNMPPGIIFVVLLFTIGVPLAEEVFFRMVQVVMTKRFSAIKAVTISAFLFGFCHIDSYIFPFSLSGILLRLIPITIYGLVHAWTFYKTKSTYSSMISHIVGNSAEAFILISFFNV